MVKTKTFFPPVSVLDFFRKLDTLRPLLIEAAFQRGCDLSFADERNRAFSALEYLEQRYLRHFLHELNQLLHLRSVILVHDGFYQGVSALEGLKLCIFSAF